MRNLFSILAIALIAGCGGGIDRPVDAAPALDTGPPRDAGPPRDTETFQLVDGDRTWTATGEALGDHEPLDSLTGHNAFWFAWSVFHPGTRVFGDAALIEGSVPPGDAECTVPCDQIQPACGGRDCIPALTSPTMTDAAGATYLRDEDLVVGVLTSEGPRAYPHNILWWHEIINEEVGDERFTVTFCPLTGSALRYDRDGFVDGETVELGVSGSLYNSNLVMYDRSSESFWSQMRVESVFGSRLGSPAPFQPLFEMTWASWRTLYPDTTVVSEDTGHSRDYQSYPYGSYRTDHTNTFRATDPPPDSRFDNKDMVFGVMHGGEVAVYPWSVLEETAGARRGVVADEIAGTPVAIVFDLDESFVHAFDAGGVDLSLAP